MSNTQAPAVLHFTDIGDISDCKFRYNQVENGAFKFIEVG